MEIDNPFAAEIFFPEPTFVQVYCEAVANAFDAQASEVAIRIVVAEAWTITIRDNGEGFTDERFARFKKLTKPRATNGLTYQ
jgi:signal transduction histidine kinase